VRIKKVTVTKDVTATRMIATGRIGGR